MGHSELYQVRYWRFLFAEYNVNISLQRPSREIVGRAGNRVVRRNGDRFEAAEVTERKQI